jgi:guanylate kinase
MEKKLDPELLAYFQTIKAQLNQEHQEYLINHPEIKQIISDYLTKLLLHKPEDVYTFTQDYFKFFEKKSLQPNILPLLICGPSGTGKGTLVKRLLKDYPHYFALSVSYTTRHPREEDTDGVTYNFVSKDEFKKELEQGKFIEYAEYSGNFYGTNRKYVEDIINKGKICIIEIEVQGAKKIFASNLNCNFFLILPPSVEELRKRLINRNSESLENIERRLEISKNEIEEFNSLSFFQKKLVNDDFESFYGKFKEYLQSVYPLFKFV